MSNVRQIQEKEFYMVASGNAEVLLKGPAEHDPPELNDLLDKAKNNIRANYKRDNPSRLMLISLLENLGKNIEILLSSDFKAASADMRDVYLGAWIYGIETIANEYRVLNPSYQGGYIFNSGSTLYEVLSKNLGIDQNHQVTEKAKLYYLCKFYHFLFLSVYSSEPYISNDQLPQIKEELLKMMRLILVREQEDKERVLRAIPSEKSIDEGMSQLYQKYMETPKYKNPDRVMLARLAVAMTKKSLNPSTKDSGEVFQIVPRSARIKIGMLIYIMETIYNPRLLPSYVRSPGRLYDFCEEILGNSYPYLSKDVKLACLLALELYLNNEKNREVLETEFNNNLKSAGLFARPVYLDPIVRPLSVNLGKIIKKYQPSDSVIPFSKVTLTSAALGAMIASAPGYGVGYAIGYGISLTDQAGARKRAMTGVVGYALQVAMGMSSCYYGYYAVDIMITAGMERMFAKIFEALAAIVGAVGAGAVSFVIYDMSLNTALDLCKLCLHLNKTIQSDCIKESDLLFIKTLLELPREVFSDMDKEKLRKITDMTVSTSSFGLLSHSANLVVPEVDELQKPEPANALAVK